MVQNYGSGFFKNENDISKYSRRNFVKSTVSAGLFLSGFGCFIQSCEEKGIKPNDDLFGIYIKKVMEIIATIKERELKNIKKAASIAVYSKTNGYNLYAYLSGGMMPYEVLSSRPGNPQIFVIGDLGKVVRGDFVLTNDSFEVRGFAERFVRVVGITTPSIPNITTPANALDNMGVLRIEDVSELVINSHMPYTDGLIEIEGIEFPALPASGLIETMIFHSISAKITEMLAQNAIYPKIA